MLCVIALGWALGSSFEVCGCGSKEPTEQAKVEAKKELEAQFELYRKKQQSGQAR
jgi:hypothetical protein